MVRGWGDDNYKEYRQIQKHHVRLDKPPTATTAVCWTIRTTTLQGEHDGTSWSSNSTTNVEEIFTESFDGRHTHTICLISLKSNDSSYSPMVDKTSQTQLLHILFIYNV
jgi:hypothetical protein